MSLYSSDAFSNAEDGKQQNGSKTAFGPEGKLQPSGKEKKSWCYLFVHRVKMAWVNEKLKVRFPTFVHTTVSYKRENHHVRKLERPTISGLLFVQGDSRRIQEMLDEIFPGLHLVKDCSTRRIAIIPDYVMQTFMQLAQVGPSRIRFMSHTLDYYAKGHPLVKITSGQLAGFEGYQVRISRDKCLVTSLGGLTVAINGVSKETFENVDEYVQLRRQQQKDQSSEELSLTPLQQEIDASFFVPQHQLDAIVLARNLDPWLTRAEEDVRQRQFQEAVEIVLFVFEEIGARFRTLADDGKELPLDALWAVARQFSALLERLVRLPNVSADLKDYVVAEAQSLIFRYPFLKEVLPEPLQEE